MSLYVTILQVAGIIDAGCPLLIDRSYAQWRERLRAVPRENPIHVVREMFMDWLPESKAINSRNTQRFIKLYNDQLQGIRPDMSMTSTPSAVKHSPKVQTRTKEGDKTKGRRNRRKKRPQTSEKQGEKPAEQLKESSNTNIMPAQRDDEMIDCPRITQEHITKFVTYFIQQGIIPTPKVCSAPYKALANSLLQHAV